MNQRDSGKPTKDPKIGSNKRVEELRGDKNNNSKRYYNNIFM